MISSKLQTWSLIPAAIALTTTPPSVDSNLFQGSLCQGTTGGSLVASERRRALALSFDVRRSMFDVRCLAFPFRPFCPKNLIRPICQIRQIGPFPPQKHATFSFFLLNFSFQKVIHMDSQCPTPLFIVVANKRSKNENEKPNKRKKNI